MTGLHLPKNIRLSENADFIQISSVSKHRNKTQISIAWYLIVATVEDRMKDMCERVERKGKEGCSCTINLLCPTKSANGDRNG